MSATSAAGAFLRKKKDKARAPSGIRQGPSTTAASAYPGPSGPSLSSIPARVAVQPATSQSNGHATPSPSSTPNAQGSSSAPTPPNNSHIVEIKLFSGDFGFSARGDALRYNLMKLNSSQHDVEVRDIPGPVLLNRKLTNDERQPQITAFDESGKVLGRYAYDAEGRPVLDAEGRHVVEIKDKQDLSLIGGSGLEKKRAGKRAVKEVYHQDKEVMRLRREEQVPWILESGSVSRSAAQAAGDKSQVPVHWKGQYQEPAALPTVLFMSHGGDGFKVVPLGRTYKFEPDRPFKAYTSDEAHKLYEASSRNRTIDLWAHRGTAAVAAGAGPTDTRFKREHADVQRVERQAREFEQRMRMGGSGSGGGGGVALPGRRVKQERWEDDDRREGRTLARGLEGGADEELDYDVAEDFQDDDDVNTFYRDKDEEEEAKLQDEALQKQYRLANANVGDRPQIEEELEEERELFGDKRSKKDKKLAKMVRRGMQFDGMLDSSDEDSDSDSEDEAEKARKAKAEKDKADEAKRLADAAAARTAPGSAERPSRPPSRQEPGRGARGATSPGPGAGPGGRHQSPTPTKGGKSATAPPSGLSGSGSSFLAQRAASRGGSPRRSRNASPRAGSPAEGGPGGGGSRAGSPVARAMSPSAGSMRGSSPAMGSPSRDASPAPSTPGRTGKRKQSPSVPPSGASTSGPASSQSTATGTGTPGPAPAPGLGGPPTKKKKKASSKTPTPAPEDLTFPGAIQRSEVLGWFRARATRGDVHVLMGDVVAELRPLINRATTPENKALNSKAFQDIVNEITDRVAPPPGTDVASKAAGAVAGTNKPARVFVLKEQFRV